MDSPRRIRAILGVGAAAALVVVSLAGAQSVRADTQICEQFGSTTSGNYIVMNNAWGTTATQCINVTTNGFSIIQQDGQGNMSGAPASYPAIYLGCHYDTCSPDASLPMQISQIGTAMTSTTETYVSSGVYDAAYDIWLNATTDTSGVQDTEIMIWLNHTGTVQPVGSQTGSASIAGKSWAVWTGNNGSNNVVSYVANPTAITSITFDVKAFINDTLSRGSQYGSSSWYLTSIQNGFEPWQGGVGLAVSNFSAVVTRGNNGTPSPTPTGATIRPTVPTPTPTPRPPTPTPPTAPPSTGCTATWHIDNDWNQGFQATVTVTAGSSAITAWKVTWSWPGSQSIVNYWNAAVSQSGAAVTANNLGYNGSLGAGGSTSFGIQVNGLSLTPAMSCAANGGPNPTPTGTVRPPTPTPTVRPPTPTPTVQPPTPTPTVRPPTPTPSGSTKSCTATIKIDNNWGSGFQATVTVTAGSAAISGWRVTWSWPASQSIVNFWNAAVTQSGAAVTATNLSYNGSLGAGGNTTFGMQVNGSAATPTLTCTAS